MSRSNVFVALVDKSYDGDVIRWINSLRVCFGENELSMYDNYVNDCVNSRSNYQHEFSYRELAVDAVVDEPKYLVVGLDKDSIHKEDDIMGEPVLSTARLFDDLKAAEAYGSSLPTKEYTYSAVIPMESLKWDCEEEEGEISVFPNMVDEREITYVRTKKAKATRAGK